MTGLVPTLNTARLRLVPLAADCAAAYTQFYTDAVASAHYGGPLSAAGALNRLASDIGGWTLQGFGVWAIEAPGDHDPRAIVGVCGFWQGLGWPLELTWWLLPQARGRGIAAEASRAAVRHAYDAWHWPAVHTYMNDDNAAARALVLRLGGVKVARRAFPDARERDVFRLPRPEEN